MFRSFAIKNFRCFRDVTLGSLERINLIAGMNNTGKTALLEALFLHAGPNNPNLTLKINVFRGVQQFEVNAEEMWGWLFFKKQTDATIELTGTTKNNEQRTLTVRLVKPQSGAASAAPAGAVPERELLLEYVDAQQQGISRGFLVHNGVQTEPANLNHIPPGVFLHAHARYPREDAERYSKLEEVGRQGDVLAALRQLEPRLRRLAVLVSAGAPMIHADVGMGRLLPLPLMGEGVGRLLAIVLAVASAPEGTVLIDEVEDGLHQSMLRDAWQVIADLARKVDAQVFATTHSFECIESAHSTFKDSGRYDLRVHRLDRLDDEVFVVTYE